jgi:type III secretory pathway component EscS
MIDALGLAIREGFGLVLAATLPLFLVAAVAAVLLGLLADALGIRDGALAQIVRALAVILMIAVIVGDVGEALVGFAVERWSSLAELEW